VIAAERLGGALLFVAAIPACALAGTPPPPQAVPWLVAAGEPTSKEALFGTAGESKPGAADDTDEEEPEAAPKGGSPGSTGNEPPASKDALFGTGKPGEPASKEAPLGASAAPADASAPKIWGSFDALGAYTYADPEHWSRGVGRFALAASGALSGSVNWKLSGRVDADIVYATSNFYLEPVKVNERFSAIWGENYLDVSAGSWDFRLGAQHIIWGEVIGIFVADVVSARDQREFLLPDFDVIRIPQWAARAEYYAGDAHLELIWIPVPTFDRIGKPGADFYPAPLPSPTPAAVAGLFKDPLRPDRTLSNGNYGVRANTLVSGWDVSAFYYRSFSTDPTFYRQLTGDPAQPFVYQPLYDRIWQAGGTATKDMGEFVLRMETVYTGGRSFAVTSLDAARGVVQRNTFDYVVSADFPLAGDTHLNVQAFQRVYAGGSDSMVIKSDGFGASVFLSTKLTSSLEPQILWLQNFKDAGGLIRPRLNWRLERNTLVGFGVDIFTGPSDGFFGRFNNRDRVYSELRVDF